MTAAVQAGLLVPGGQVLPAADRLGLRDRGRVAPGLRADLVLLDPGSFIDTATYERPCQAPPGVRRVLVAGRDVLDLPHPR